MLYWRPMKYLRKVVAVTLLAGLFCGFAFAQKTESPMTERELSKLISDWPAVVKWLEERGKDIDADASGAAMAAYFKGADFESFLKGKGWTTERFSYVAGTAFLLYGYITWELENPDVAKQFDDAIAEVRANAALSAAEKAEMIRGLEEGKKAVLNLAQEAEINEAELKLVRTRYQDMKKIAESME